MGDGLTKEFCLLRLVRWTQVFMSFGRGMKKKHTQHNLPVGLENLSHGLLKLQVKIYIFLGSVGSGQG